MLNQRVERSGIHQNFQRNRNSGEFHYPSFRLEEALRSVIRFALTEENGTEVIVRFLYLPICCLEILSSVVFTDRKN